MSTTHEIAVVYQTETALAICVRETSTGPDVWLPKSSGATIEAAFALFRGAPPRRGQIVTLTAPETLLTEKGLL